MAPCVSTVFECVWMLGCVFLGKGVVVGGGFARRAHMMRARHVS